MEANEKWNVGEQKQIQFHVWTLRKRADSHEIGSSDRRGRIRISVLVIYKNAQLFTIADHHLSNMDTVMGKKSQTLLEEKLNSLFASKLNTLAWKML